MARVSQRSAFQSPDVESLGEATLEVLTGMKAPSVLGGHSGSSPPQPWWSLSIKRLMLSLNVLALRITVNDCRKMDSSPCIGYAQAFYPAGTMQPIQVLLCWD